LCRSRSFILAGWMRSAELADDTIDLVELAG
jgi:hypothetical protein